MNDDSAFPTLARRPSALWRAVSWTGRGIKWTWLHTWRWIAGLILLAILAHTAANIVTGRELERELKKLRAAGEPLTLAQAAPKPVPASRNAAVLYQQAFKYLPSEQAELALDRIGPVFSRKAEGEWSKVSWSELEKFVGRHHRAIELLEQAAKKPECRFPVHWEAGWEALFPHLGDIRGAARLLAAKAIADAHQGRTAQAMSAVETALRISEHVAAEPTLIAQLVRYACLAITLRALNSVMEINPPGSEESERLDASLARIDLTGPFIAAIKTERALGLSTFDLTRKDPRAAWQLLQGFTTDARRARSPEWLPPLVFFLLRPFLNKDQLFYLRSTERQISAARLPYREAYGKIRQLERWREKLPKYALVTGIVAPVFGRVGAVRDKALAGIGLAQWGLAINVYRIKEGRWPKSLDQVRRTIAWKLPLDPFSGKSFVYRLEPRGQALGKPRGYLLYSIGPNLRDDGGVAVAQRPWTYKKPEQVPDDVTWRVRAPAGS